MPVIFKPISIHYLFLRMTVLGMVLFWNIVSAQEIYDKKRQLFVAEGTLIHTVATSRPYVTKKKRANFVRISRKKRIAKVIKNTCKPVIKKYEICESVKPVIGPADRKKSTLICTRCQNHYGILSCLSCEKCRHAAADAPYVLFIKILFTDDIVKHKYLYRESHRQFEKSCHNSCRPPPNVPQVHILSLVRAAAVGVYIYYKPMAI